MQLQLSSCACYFIHSILNYASNINLPKLI